MWYPGGDEIDFRLQGQPFQDTMKESSRFTFSYSRCTGASLQAVFAVAFLPDSDALKDLWSEFSDDNGVRLVGTPRPAQGCF